MKLTLEKPVYGGDCLAHTQSEGDKAGKAIFVPLTLPGETVSVNIAEEKRSHATAELDQILTPSPNRVPAPCPYFGQCGGCHYQHANYPTQLALKTQILRETLTRAKVQIPPEIAVLATDPWAYRNRIRLAADPSGALGYRARRSHEIIPINECPIAAPILAESAPIFTSVLENKTPHKDLVEIELFTNQVSSELLITFHFNHAEPVVRGLRAVPGTDSSRPLLERNGQDFLTYIVANFPYRVPAGAFFQINRHLLDDFASLVTANPTGQTAWDLYAGVGLFARQLAVSFNEVIAVESAPASIPALELNLTGTNARAIPSTTLDYLRRNRQQREPRPDLIVLDPPRAGLGPEVATLLNQIHAPEMVYVSCDPATLARDLRALTEERYQIESITLADMFPQTFHIETVVKLRRA